MPTKPKPTKHAPQLTQEDVDLLAKGRHWLDFIVKISPLVGVLLTVVLFFTVWQPLADIREHTKDIAHLQGIPQTLKDSEERLSEDIQQLDAKVAELAALPGSVARLAKDLGDANQSISDSAATSNSASQKVVAAVEDLDGLKTSVDTIQAKLKELETLPQGVKATTEAVAALDTRVKEMAKPAARRSSTTVVLPFGKIADVAESGVYRMLTYTVTLKDLPGIAAEHYDHLEIERTEVVAGKSSPITAIESRLNAEKASLVVSVWVQPNDAERVMDELARRELQVLLTVSRPLP